MLISRENKTGRLVATGHRSVKRVFVNGKPATVGYLGGLRVEPGVRSASFLARGYAQLRDLRAGHSTSFDLSTIMEDNFQARKVLLSKRLGLPGYHDIGRFCCMALSLQAKSNPPAGSKFTLRNATQADVENVVAFLNREGRAKQFFPEYRAEDFGCPGGLLSHLEWTDVFLAFRGAELVGVLAAWDQRAFRRWRVTGYARWLRLSRPVLNLAARLRRMPLLPNPGSPLNCFNLALVCIRDNDLAMFKALLDEIIRARQDRFAVFLAGLHECDPLLPELLSRPHVSLASRLYVVDLGKRQLRRRKTGSPAGSLFGIGSALMKLESQIVAANELRSEEAAQMCRLMQAHYEGVTERQFLADLNAKQWAILLRDKSRLCGFSTQILFDHSFDGATVKIVFSGDTVIEKSHWGSLALPVAWGRLMLSLLAKHPGTNLYWLLTSKGYKTYRFLPVFFREFYPCHNQETPAFEKNIVAKRGCPPLWNPL